MRYFIVCIFILLTNISRSQNISTDYDEKKSRLIYACYNYSATLIGDVFPSSGLHSSFGINVASILKKKYILGLFIDVRFFKIFGSNNQYGNLTGDVNRYQNDNQNNPGDSIRVSFLVKAFNSDKDVNFEGSYLGYYGIMFSPFPDNYGGIMFQLKKGDYNFPIFGAYNVPHLSSSTSDFIFLIAPVDFNIQLTFKPFSLCKGKIKEKVGNNIFFSVFYEKLSLQTAELDGTDLTTLLDPGFFEKHGTDYHLGVKISYGIY